MKRLLIAVISLVAFCVGGVAVAGAAGGPEVDRANATLGAKGQVEAVRCPGEDGISYITYRGALSGGETETTPGFTDYNLTGTLNVPNVVWTINLKTKRGLWMSPVVLTNAAGGSPTYQGNLVLITQGLPTATAATPARGWIDAQTFTNGQADGGFLLANVAAQLTGPTPSLTLNAVFGNNPPFAKIANYAVTWNGLTC